jgi:hypothetical protein
VLLTALSYKLLVALFGLGSQVPFRLVLALSVAAVGVLVFLLVSARAGEVIGLACAAVVVLLGAAWEDLLFFASIDLIASLATGLGAIWALEGDTRRKNVLACLLLVCSVGFSNVGIPFAAAAAVAIALRRRPSQLWVAVVPAVLFAVWWLVDGSREPSHLSATNVEHLPRYLYDSVAAGLASVAGLNRGTVPGTYTRGHVLIAVVATAIVISLLRGWRPRASVLVPLTAALTFWSLTGASFIPGREPFASRYQLINASLLLLIGAELFRPVKVGKTAGALVVAIAVAVVWSNVDSRLSYGYRFLRDQSGFVKADLGALQLGRRLAPPNLWLTATVARNPYLSGVTARRLFAETNAHGWPPTYSSRQLTTAPAPQRQAADSVLAFAERIPPTRTKDHPAPTNRCVRLQTTGAGLNPELALHAGTWLLTDVGKAALAIGVRRFAPPSLRSYIGLISPASREQTTIPTDTVSLPWRLSIEGSTSRTPSALRACPQ